MRHITAIADDTNWPPGTFVSQLPETLRRKLLTLGVFRSYPAGKTLIRQGERSTLVLIIMSGIVKVTARTENGKEVLLAVRVKGDVLGDLAALNSAERSATVATCQVTVALVIKGPVFLNYLNTHPTAALTLTKHFGDRLRWANQRRLDFTGYDSAVCLARILLEIASLHGRSCPEGIEVGLGLTQAELGSLIGAQESTVYKALRELSRQGLVHTGKRRVVVTDITGLREFAGLDTRLQKNHVTKPY